LSVCFLVSLFLPFLLPSFKNTLLKIIE
jgi:hypothetical protein